MSSSPAELATPTARRAGQPDPQWEAAVNAGHHPLAFCEWCDQPVPGVLSDCPDPACQRKATDLDMWFVRREDV